MVKIKISPTSDAFLFFKVVYVDIWQVRDPLDRRYLVRLQYTDLPLLNIITKSYVYLRSSKTEI